MNVSIVADVLLIAAAVAWILARQVQVGRVKPRLLRLVPKDVINPNGPWFPLSPAALARPMIAAGSPCRIGGWRHRIQMRTEMTPWSCTA